MSDRALLIGGSGQDGAYLAERLLRDGMEVHVTTRGLRDAPMLLDRLGLRPHVRVHRIELTDPGSIAHLLRSAAFDQIYYLAAQSSVAASFSDPVQTFDASTRGLLHTIETIRGTGGAARLVYAASGDCFGERRESGPASEVDRFAPRSPYGVAKCAGAHLVSVMRNAFGLHLSTAYLFSHESPLRSDRFVIGKTVQAVRRIRDNAGERLRLGNLDVVRDWGWAPDYADALQRMACADTPDDYVVATGTGRPLQEVVEMLFAAADLDWREHVDVAAMPPRPADLLVSTGDPTKAKTQLGWVAQHRFPEMAGLLLQ